MLLNLATSPWVTIAPVIIINVIALTTLALFGITRKRLEKPEYLKGRHESKFLGSFVREWWYWFTDPIAKFLIRMRLSPNSITLIGFLISVVSALFFAGGLFGIAGWFMVFGATFDMFDGRVARLMNKSTRSGAYLDSVMDRFGEGVVFVGLAYHFRDSWVLIPVIIALIGSTMVSYTRARGEGVGVVCKKGSMQRPERIVYVGVSSILTPMAYTLMKGFWADPAPVLVIAALVFIAVMANITAVYRMIYIMNELDSVDKDANDKSIPQVLSALTTKVGREKWLVKNKYGYDRSEATKKMAVMIVANSVNYEIFSKLLNAGELPNIKKYITDPGSFIKAVSTFPTSTGPAFTPFITGCSAGSADIPGARWFDRRVPPAKKLTIRRFRDYFGWGSYAFDMDLSKNVNTIFEYSKRAVNILGMMSRGAGVIRDPAFFRAPLLFYRATKKDDIETAEKVAFRMFSSAVNKSPDFILYYFPSIDADPEEATLHRLDGYVGKMVDLLKSQRLFDSTALILSGDHGYSMANDSLDLAGFMSKRFETVTDHKSFKYWAEKDAISLVSGGGMANIYIKDGDWSRFNFIEKMISQGIVGELLEEDAVDILAGRSSKGGIVVMNRQGYANIVEDADGRISYSVAGADPFGYENIPANLSSAEVIRSTYDTKYPAGILQMAEIFRSPRAGDLVISARAGYNLRAGAAPAVSRGALHADHAFVPMCVSEKVDSRDVRTVDVFPTVLRLLGIVPTHKIDGRSLIVE